MPSYLGTKQTIAGLPSLLLSDLDRVQDPVVKRALYQIQNYSNSIGAVSGSTGSGTATLGTAYPGVFTVPQFWMQVSHNGLPAWIPVWE
jgi:hypothetical protein